MEGRVIGQYRVTGVLGRGGMGVVYAAKHTLLDRPAAVKVLLSRLSGQQEILTRFFNEARATTAIRHPGIVEVYEYGRTRDGSAFIVMELLQGETLRARRRRGPMRWSTALALVRQIAGALGAAHTKGIVHRDLKPANIFLVPDPEVPGGERIKLLDFGIAKLAGSSSDRHKTRTGTVIGTPRYMAPEQCRGVAIDSRADLYSLGCILFELCTGRPPFLYEAEGDMLVAHIREQPPTLASLMSGVPAEIEALVQRMLAKSPADRVQSADEVIRLIDAARTAIGQNAQPSPPALPAPASSPPNASASADRELEDESAPTQPKYQTQRAGPETPHPESITDEEQDEEQNQEQDEEQDDGQDQEPDQEQDEEQDEEQDDGQDQEPDQEQDDGQDQGQDQEAAGSAKAAMLIALRPDTTLSSAAGTRPRAATRAPTRRFPLVWIGGGIVIVGALTLTLVVSVRRGDGDAAIQGASSPPVTEPPPAVVREPIIVEPVKPHAVPSEVTPPARPDGAGSAAEDPASPASPADPADPQNPKPHEAPPLPEPNTSKHHDDANRRAKPAPSRPSVVTITFDSIPQGAWVQRVSDREVVCKTPCTTKVDPRGSNLEFVLRYRGYRPKSVQIHPDKSLEYTVTLGAEPAPRSSSPSVESQQQPSQDRPIDPFHPNQSQQIDSSKTN